MSTIDRGIAIGRPFPGELPHPSVHRLDLRFEVDNDLLKVPWGCAQVSFTLVRALAQRPHGERHPPRTTLEAGALELGA
jgi:hypothetical protein